VTQELPPPQEPVTSFATRTVESNGLHAYFDESVHCLAAEPFQTILRLAVIDAEQEVAYETAVLGALRPGFRCVQLRSKLGTRIEMCYAFVHIECGVAPNAWLEMPTLRRRLHEQALELDKLKAREAAHIELQHRLVQQQEQLAALAEERDERAASHAALTRQCYALQGERRDLEATADTLRAKVEFLESQLATTRVSVGSEDGRATRDEADVHDPRPDESVDDGRPVTPVSEPAADEAQKSIRSPSRLPWGRR